MPISLKAYFQQHTGFQQRSGTFFQNHLVHSSEFERHYLQLRKQEGRVYNDSQLLQLPGVPQGHAHQQEWTIRKDSANRLISYLHKKKMHTLVEIGCGNGWLLRYLHEALKTGGAGIDMNVMELEQAARVFGNIEELSFVHADILSDVFDEPLADVIVVASVIQYFPDLSILVNKLLNLLLPHGEIHILDSPLYSKREAPLAKERSDDYFRKAGCSNMTNFYFHHTWESLRGFNHQVLYDPGALWNKVSRLKSLNSPFPWIKISLSDY